MIDEIDYFPKRERHNKKKKVDSGWNDLKKQKNKQDDKSPPPLEEKNPKKNLGKGRKNLRSTGAAGMSRLLHCAASWRLSLRHVSVKSPHIGL